MQAQTERSVHAGGAREERERQRGREERKRLHLLDAPALGSLPISVSREGSGVKMQNAYRKLGKKRENGSEGVCVYR